MTSQFVNRRHYYFFFCAALFLCSSLVTGVIFLSVSSLVLELWQLGFIRDWLKIQKLLITLPVWVLSNTWQLRQVRDTKFGINVSNKMLLNPIKCQGYSFYRFRVIKVKLAGRYNLEFPPLPEPQPNQG